MAKYIKLEQPKDDKNAYGLVQGPPYEYVAWQNVKDVEVPDWLRGYVEGVPGSTLKVNAPALVGEVKKGEWLVQRSDGVLTHETDKEFTAHYKAV
jgi:hypothetical protein